MVYVEEETMTSSTTRGPCGSSFSRTTLNYMSSTSTETGNNHSRKGETVDRPLKLYMNDPLSNHQYQKERRETLKSSKIFPNQHKRKVYRAYLTLSSY